MDLISKRSKRWASAIYRANLQLRFLPQEGRDRNQQNFLELKLNSVTLAMAFVYGDGIIITDL